MSIGECYYIIAPQGAVSPRADRHNISTAATAAADSFFVRLGYADW